MKHLNAYFLAAGLSILASQAHAEVYHYKPHINAGESVTFVSNPIASTQTVIDDVFTYKLASGISSVKFLFNIGLPGRELNAFSVTPSLGSISPAVSGGSNWVSETYEDEDGYKTTASLLSKIEYQWGVIGLNDDFQTMDIDAMFEKAPGGFDESVSYSLTITAGPAAVVSEPESLALAISGLALMAGLGRFRSRAENRKGS